MTSLVSPMAATDALTQAASGGGVRAGYGVSLTDLSGFQDAMARAQAGIGDNFANSCPQHHHHAKQW